MKTAQVKKTFVLGVLFVLPLVAYLFFASGVNNFGRLPIMTEVVEELPENKAGVFLASKISIVGYLGSDLSQRQVNMFNLNQKISKRFSEFTDFQMLMVLPDGTQVKQKPKVESKSVQVVAMVLLYSQFLNGARY